MKRISAVSPIAMQLQMNLAIYHAEIRHDLNTAIEQIETILIDTFENVNVFAMDNKEGAEIKRLVIIL